MPTVVESIAQLRRGLGSVRGRATALSVATVLLALILGGAAMLLAFRGALIGNLDSSLQQQAQDRARLLTEGSEPGSLTELQEEESFVWIGRPDGTLLAVGGSYIPTENPVPERIGAVQEVTLAVEERSSDGVEIERSAFRVASASTADGRIVVLTAAELETVGRTLVALASLFAVAIPVVAGLVGALTWRSAGSALVPVENIRRQAERITGSSMSERVPVPATTDEIRDLATTVNEMLDRLENHRDSLRQFTSDASHELKSPIANMRAIVETASLTDPAWLPVRDRLVSEGARLQSLVENLLFLSAHSEASTRPEPATVNLDDILFDEAAMLAASSGISVTIERVEPATVHGIAADLRRLVRNLFDNAAQHAASTVRISLSDEPGGAVFSVADDGPGIPVADRVRVFERFTRLDYARDRNNGGTGLGLSIVQSIVEDHAATVRIDDATPTGAVFTVTFPPSPDIGG